MIYRRRILQAGLGALDRFRRRAAGALAQSKPRVKVRYNEVVRSFFFYRPMWLSRRATSTRSVSM